MDAVADTDATLPGAGTAAVPVAAPGPSDVGPSDVGPAGVGPLRDSLPDRVLARDAGAPGTPLAVFQAEGRPERLLVQWFGDAALLRRPLDRERIKRALDRDIAWIDGLLSDQVNAVLHHPRLQRLEASWRGIAYLVDQAVKYQAVNDDPARNRIKIRVLDVSWAELCRDLERAIEFDQSQIFDKVYNEEFGMPGGEPYGVLIGDYEVQHRRGRDHPTDDIAALKAMAQVAAAAFAPFIVGCAPPMLGLDDFAELGLPIDLGAIFRQPEYARWRSLRDAEDSRFLGITLPRVLMRLPYAEHTFRTDGFAFHEDVERPDLGGYLWGPACYAFAGVLIRAFAGFGWFADIRGAPRDEVAGGMVTDLPVHGFGTDAHGLAIRASTDVVITERLENELGTLGFMPLSKCKDTEFSAFYSNHSVQQPKRYDRQLATVNAQLSAMLQYILCVARFSHYVKVMVRDRIGSMLTPEDCQDYIYRWLMNYTTSNDNAPLSQKAKFPLREAAVQVRELPGRPGEYAATLHLRPHFQLDQVVSSFRLVTELAAPRPH